MVAFFIEKKTVGYIKEPQMDIAQNYYLLLHFKSILDY